MIPTIKDRRALWRIRKEQTSKVGRQAQVRLFHWLPPFLGIIPLVKFNRNALRRGRIISEKNNGDGMEYTVRFQTSQPYWDIYPANAIEILPETKK